jgi:uncharacterized protein YqjF (DUF2071 family)
MRGEDVLFVNWPVDPATLASHVPERLPLDTRDGRVWVSVVARVMADVGPPGLPTGYTFAEADLRTCVEGSALTGNEGADPVAYYCPEIPSVAARLTPGSLV